MPYVNTFRFPQQRSLADMANEQLRRGKPKDGFETGVDSAQVADCLRYKNSTASGLLALPALLLKKLRDECPK